MTRILRKAHRSGDIKITEVESKLIKVMGISSSTLYRRWRKYKNTQ